MVDARPGDGGAERLKAYWVNGPGAAKIRWNTPGDFERCTKEINGAIVKDGRKPLADPIIKGLCSNLHVRATGFRPGKAPGDKAGT